MRVKPRLEFLDFLKKAVFPSAMYLSIKIRVVICALKAQSCYYSNEQSRASCEVHLSYKRNWPAVTSNGVYKLTFVLDLEMCKTSYENMLYNHISEQDSDHRDPKK